MTGIGIYQQGFEPWGGLNEYADEQINARFRFRFKLFSRLIFLGKIALVIKPDFMTWGKLILKYGKRWLKRHPSVVDVERVRLKPKKDGE